MVKTENEEDFIVATPSASFHVKSIKEAIYCWNVKNATLYIKNQNKDTYKYFCNVIVDESED